MAAAVPDDVSRLVPGCAQACFLSFLQSNYGAASPDPPPPLGWLCSTPGDSGYTVGEGAVQCLAAEKALGACSQREASPLVVYRAHRMCHGVPRAIRPTHGVVTATLVFPDGGGRGQVSFPPSRSTRSVSESVATPSTATSGTTVAEATQSTTPSPTDSSSSETSSTSNTPSYASETQAHTDAPAGLPDGTQQDGGSGAALTDAQKAGIAIGVIGLVALVAAIVSLFAFFRKRKRNPYRRADSSEALNRRDTWGYPVAGAGGTTSWLARPNQPVPPPPPSGAFTPPSAPPSGQFLSTTWCPSAIGLAVSPGHHRSTQTTPPPRSTPPRPLSRLLPAMPAMAAKAPRRASHPHQSVCPQIRLVHATPPSATRRGRDSAATEFDIDGGPASPSPQGRIWRPPSNNGATSYVQDKGGNWVLCDAPPPRQGVANACVLPAAQRAIKVESRSPLLTAAEHSRPPAADVADPPAAGAGSPDLRQRPLRPKPLFSSARLSQSRRGRATSAHSGVTTIASLSDDDHVDDDDYDDDDDDGCDCDDAPPQVPASPLSPVTESPRPAAVARPSLVAYPPIVTPSSDPRRRRHAPRPDSSTMRLVEPSPGPSTMGASTMRLVKPSPPPSSSPSPPHQNDRAHLPSVSRAPSLPPHPPSSPNPPNWTSRLPARPQPVASRTVWLPAPPHHVAPHHHHHHSHGRDHLPPRSDSSLIAKRLGPLRAAHMSIATAPPPLDRSHSPPARPANPHRRPDAAGDNGRSGRRQSTSGPLDPLPELVTSRPLPDRHAGGSASPCWVPGLTPTRRGPHLYLDVR